MIGELEEGQLGQLVSVVLRFLSTADSSILVGEQSSTSPSTTSQRTTPNRPGAPRSSPISPTEGAESFAEEHGVSAAALRPPLLALLVFFKAAARRSMSVDLVKLDMERFGHFPAPST